MPHITHALTAILAQRRWTTKNLARIVEVSQSTISRTMHGRRIHADTLRALCTALPEQSDGLDILIAHLRDEIDRAGRCQTEIRIEADTQEHRANIRLLAKEARIDPELAAILDDLADLVGRGRGRAAIRATAPET